jgi:Phage gp6-like head-tail connector protein
MALATLDEARGWLRITYQDEDSTLTLCLEGASEAVIRYLKDAADPNWTHESVPANIKIAVLRQTENLWVNRGAGAPDYQHTRQADGYLSPEVTELLYAYRVPTVR